MAWFREDELRDAMDSKVKELSEKIEGMVQQLTNSEGENVRLKGELDGLQDRLATKETDTAHLKQQVSIVGYKEKTSVKLTESDQCA